MAGTYGIEYVDFDGNLINLRDLGPLRPPLDALLPQWQALIEGKRGFFLEDKGWSLAMHAKNASERDAAQVLKEARQLAQSAISQGPYRLKGDRLFLEISPISAGKAHAVTSLLGLFPSPNAGVLYFGDDQRDEEAFPGGAGSRRHGRVRLPGPGNEGCCQVGISVGGAGVAEQPGGCDLDLDFQIEIITKAVKLPTISDTFVTV